MFSKMIRIFISSTFINFIEERDRFVEIYNELSSLCKSAGFSFQVLDLRWGITDEDSRENRTLQICLDEIARCQVLSPKPNFLILSGMYYGWIPLPPCIPQNVWDKIKIEIPASSSLRNWYLQDENDAGNSYVLKSRTGDDCSGDRWKETEDMLKKELFPLVRKYFPDKDSYYYIWGLSATEQEIYKGLFSCPENRSHVFALIRTSEPQNCKNLEPENMRVRAAELQEQIKGVMGEYAETNTISYAPGDDYIEKTKSFLKQVIQSRIDETLAYEEKLDVFDRELRLLKEAVRQSEKRYINTGHDVESFLRFCKGSRGMVVLLTGQSGSGKTTLLKHCYYTERDNTVLSCADILSSCCGISHALWFCLKQLEEKGLITAPDTAPDAGQCGVWFERQLQDFGSNEPVMVFLDCVDQIYDWNQIGGSLLECRLPKNLTLVISCISKASLNKRDCRKRVLVYQLTSLAGKDSVHLLENMLHNCGRVLRVEDKEYIVKRLPGLTTPLYIHTLCQQLQKRRSFDLNPIVLPHGTKESIYNQLNSQSSSYPVMYRHAIGYLALASDGLSELELLALLERDILVNQEVDWLSHWKAGQKSLPIAVLWARIFYELKDYLSESDSNGILLLRFHHALTREAAKEIVGQKRLRVLAYNISNYFQKEPVYLGQINNTVIVNSRKLRELFPALCYRNSWKAVANLLEDPEYTDGYLRCGWYRELMQQFVELARRKCLNEKHQKLLLLLQKKAMQFQLWGDSFLPAATEIGLYPVEKALGLGCQYVLRRKTNENTGKKLVYEKFCIPNAVNVKIGVKEDGTLAVLDGKVLKRYDLNLHSEIYHRCYINVSNAFLYWKGNRLMVRDISCRITFWDTGSELVLEKSEKVPSNIDLYSDNQDKINRAGGLDERDSEGFHSDTVFQYQSGGILKDTELFYPVVETIRCFCHGALCAVLLNQTTLDILDLDKRLLLFSYPAPNAHYAYWNPQGTEVLVVFEGDTVLRFPCSYENSKPMATPYAPLKEHAKTYLKRIGRREVLTIFQFACPVNGQDTPAHLGSLLGSRKPMYAAFSIKSDRLACYYYYLNEGIIRLFRLSDREFLAESKVDTVFWKDSAGNPLYFQADGSELILISRGKRYIWNMSSLKWDCQAGITDDSKIEVVHSIQQKYASCMEPWLPAKERTTREKSWLRRFLRKAVLVFAFPFIRNSQIEKDHTMLHKKMQQIPVLESGGLWWVLDNYHGMVHVCDQDGNWLCHEQLLDEIFNFDIIDRDVYALPINLTEPIALQITTINNLK